MNNNTARHLSAVLFTLAFCRVLYAVDTGSDIAPYAINEPDSTITPAAAIAVQYALERIEEIKAWVRHNQLVFVDYQAVGPGQRRAQLSALSGNVALLLQIASHSGLFRKIITQNPPHYPGVFFVTADNAHGPQVNQFLDRYKLRPQLWGHYIFQCQVPDGEEQFWMHIVRREPGVKHVAYNSDFIAGLVHVHGTLTPEQANTLEEIAKSNGLYYAPPTDNTPVFIHVPPGDEQHYVELLKASGIDAGVYAIFVLGGEIDTTVDLAYKDPSAQSNVHTKLSLEDINTRVRAGMENEFPTATIIPFQANGGFRVDDLHYGPRVLSTVRRYGWEHISIPIVLRGFDEHGDLKIYIRVQTWISTKGTSTSPPRNTENFDPYVEGPPFELTKAENAYAELLIHKIEEWLR